jgi:hypothetical protein
MQLAGGHGGTFMDNSTVSVVLGQLRTVLAAVGGLLVMRGFLSDETLNQIIGVVVIIVPAVWSAWDKIQSERASKAREVVALNAGIQVADATVGKTNPVSAAAAPAVLEAVATYAPLPVAQSITTASSLGKGVAKP